MGTGLRERKKEATREGLHEAALRLAAERGPDRVTIDDIADAAGVCRRTFSNYFSGIQEALLYREQERMRLLLDLIQARPAREPAWTALTRAAFARWTSPTARPAACFAPASWTGALPMRHRSCMPNQSACEAAAT